MDKLLCEEPPKPNDRDCHSPLGLFEKFKLENDVACFTDPDLQPSPESPYTEMEKNHSPQNVNKLILKKTSLIEKMRGIMSMASAVSNRKEGESCALLGSWNADAKEVETLDELESPSDQTELGHEILIQDVCDEDDVIICQLSNKKVKDLLNTARPADNLQVVDNPNPKVKLGKRKPKEKTHDKEKELDFLIPTSTKSPKGVRDTTVQTLYEVLIRRVNEIKNLDVPEASLRTLAENIEREIFSLYNDTRLRYKTKYRSLLFNLKDPKNEAFFQSVVLGEIIPQCLVQMSPAEMARQELADWRNQERQHTLEIIERAEKELNQKQQRIKLTHKGLIEIDKSHDQMFTLEDLSTSAIQDAWTVITMVHASPIAEVQTNQGQQDAPWHAKVLQSSNEKTSDTTAQHKTHLLDLNCLICMGKIKPSDTMDMSQWTKVRSPINVAKENNHVEKRLSSEAGTAIDSMEKYALNAKSQQAYVSQSAVWKGLIQMFSIKQFKVTAMQVSGYSAHLCEKLPKMITSKGFICQESVWEYLDLIWPSCTKDMCLLRFCPQTSSDAVFYSRLYSYLNRKLRYVIINSHKMEAFIIPLPACQPIPPKLRPLGGQGLDDDHPHLLLALLLPSHPSWSSCPRKVRKIQREDELDIPDDIFSSILEDVEREEKQMEEQRLPPVEQESAGVGEVGMPELINILCLLSNNMQEIAAQSNNNFHTVPLANQPNPMPATAPVWPSYLMAPSFQAPASCGNNPSAMFDPSTMFGPSGFNPFTF